jgi:hypothetical protein
MKALRMERTLVEARTTPLHFQSLWSHCQLIATDVDSSLQIARMAAILERTPLTNLDSRSTRPSRSESRG